MSQRFSFGALTQADIDRIINKRIDAIGAELGATIDEMEEEIKQLKLQKGGGSAELQHLADCLKKALDEALNTKTPDFGRVQRRRSTRSSRGRGRGRGRGRQSGYGFY